MAPYQYEDFQRFFKLFVIVALIQCHSSMFLASGQNYHGYESCETPSRTNGICIEIRQCTLIVELLVRAPRPLSPQIINFLKSYRCGYSSNGVKVCCPGVPSTSVNIADNNSGYSRQPPDVSNHRNRRLLPTNCGAYNTDDRIVGGQRTRLFEFPWMALLSYRTARGPDFRCGASIINDHYVLTAAHCLSNLKAPLLGVRVGEYDIHNPVDCQDQRYGGRVCSPPVQDLAIEEIIPHPQYNATAFIHDIGLVRVTRMNLAVANVKPVCLPIDDVRLMNFTDRYAIVTGWGATESGRASNVLLKVELPFVGYEQCRSIYEGQVPITYRQLCAGGHNRKDSCGGDSGGPLQMVANLYEDSRYIQYGVVSFGPRNCGLEGSPGVYTNVAYYMDWILNTIRR